MFKSQLWRIHTRIKAKSSHHLKRQFLYSTLYLGKHIYVEQLNELLCDVNYNVYTSLQFQKDKLPVHRFASLNCCSIQHAVSQYKTTDWMSLATAWYVLVFQPVLLILFFVHNPFLKRANWIFMRLQLPSQVCLTQWYPVLYVLFANVPCAITHFLLMPIKMVITSLIICVKKQAGLRSDSLESNGKQQTTVWTNIWPIKVVWLTLNDKRVKNVRKKFP